MVGRRVVHLYDSIAVAQEVPENGKVTLDDQKSVRPIADSTLKETYPMMLVSPCSSLGTI